MFCCKGTRQANATLIEPEWFKLYSSYVLQVHTNFWIRLYYIFREGFFGLSYNLYISLGLFCMLGGLYIIGQVMLYVVGQVLAVLQVSLIFLIRLYYI